ncbi:hypothetical protein OIU74_011205 [Salix koriyanagi]|uniref:Uncharacterized protein n=1 Tax=Salix koriyanagi TaxID=2511006 RepID=A0A9Q0TEQ0_9ROSI|nr:hypothetical protein OIU74_011205 [Salix koriyanagi]
MYKRSEGVHSAVKRSCPIMKRNRAPPFAIRNDGLPFSLPRMWFTKKMQIRRVSLGLIRPGTICIVLYKLSENSYPRFQLLRGICQGFTIFCWHQLFPVVRLWPINKADELPSRFVGLPSKSNSKRDSPWNPIIEKICIKKNSGKGSSSPEEED